MFPRLRPPRPLPQSLPLQTRAPDSRARSLPSRPSSYSPLWTNSLNSPPMKRVCPSKGTVKGTPYHPRRCRRLPRRDTEFNEDAAANRCAACDEVVLRKFAACSTATLSLLKPFLLALLKEQIEAYYDSRGKPKPSTFSIGSIPTQQKTVMAHELTHALQDQYADLEKWDDQTPNDVSHDAAGDQDNLARDEMDTARDAVAEGQATCRNDRLQPEASWHEPCQRPRSAGQVQVGYCRQRGLARHVPRSAVAFGVNAFPLSRGPQLRTGHLDG